jgi:hypothetical protein
MNVIQHTIESPATSLAVVENGYSTNLVITQTEQILELFVNNQNGQIIGDQTYRNVLLHKGRS